MHKRLQILFLSLGLLLAAALPAQNVVDVQYKGLRSFSQMQITYGAIVQNGIRMYKVTYETPDVFGQLDTASGLLIVPIREEESIYPLLVYQHGTVDGPQDVPSNLQGGWELASIFASIGYVAIAPDFLGAGEGRGFHPYVHADSEASAGVDMIRAIRDYAGDNDILLNDQLFVTGYSQGGHASMALHRSLELEHSEELPLTAASHMSGPYSIGDVMREVILSDTPYFYSAYVPNTFLSYNYVYQLYDSTEQVFKQPYATWADNFFNGSSGLFALNVAIGNQLTADYGAPIARNMLQDSIVAILESDNVDHPLRQALSDNDVYEWAPQEPTRIFYCTADDQVNFMNSVLADSVMNMLGAVDLDKLDVNSGANHGQCVEPATLQTILFFAQFAEVTVDTESPFDENQLRAFPNPAGDALQIKGLEQAATVRLFSMTGQEVLRQDVQSGSELIPTNRLSAGIYLLSVEGDGIRHTEEIVIQR